MIFAMCDFSKYLIRDNVTVREALIALNRLSNDTLVLFVIDRDRRLVGTLTDGDIRRGLIEGLRVEDCVTAAMFTSFRYIYETEFSVERLKQLKEEGVK